MSTSISAPPAPQPADYSQAAAVVAAVNAEGEEAAARKALPALAACAVVGILVTWLVHEVELHSRHPVAVLLVLFAIMVHPRATLRTER